MNIEGTPSNMVARSRTIAVSTATGSNRGMSDIVHPNRTQTSRMLDIPNTWNNGSTVITMSEGCTPNSRPGISAFMYICMWLSSAPFGRPVVPEVYMMTAVSVISRWASCG
jgi:hypothetical protein